MLARALARDPARRYPSAAAFLSDLIKISAGEWTADLPDTLAVLDFQNLTGRSDDDWIGSGMAESLSVDLGRTAGLTVVPRAKVLEGAGGAEVNGPGIGRCRVRIGPRVSLGTCWRLSKTRTGVARDH